MTVCAAVLLAGAVAGLLLHFVPTSWQPTIALASGARVAMWFAVPALALAAAAHQWILTAAASLALVAGLVVQVPYYLTAAASPDGPRLTVLQANLKVAAADPAALVRSVRENGVELLAAEELTTAGQEQLIAAGLECLLPHRYSRPQDAGAGLGIWSRYPLSKLTTLPGFDLGVLSARVTAPSGDLTFVAVHLLPPYPYPSNGWLAETARLGDVLADLPRPALVAGDFNATVDHVQFRRLLTDGYADGIRQAGAGYLATYPADRWFGPVIGIDHVLTRGATATEVRTVALPGSDHRGLLVRVAARQVAEPPRPQ